MSSPVPDPVRRPPARDRLRARLLWVARLVLAAALLVGLAFLIRRIGVGALLDVFRRADLLWVAAAVAIKVAALSAGALRLRRLARPWAAPTFGGAFGILVGSYATNHLFGAGWAPPYRVWGLTRTGVSAGAGVTVVAFEKYLELLTFALVLMPPALLLGAPPSWRWTFSVWLGLTVACVVAAGVAYLVARHGRRGVLARVAAGLTALQRGGHLVAAFVLTVAMLLLEATIFYCALRAVGVHIGVPGTLFAFMGAQIAFMVPGPPSSIGALEAGVVLTLEACGVAAGPALAAALLYHAIPLAPELALGVPALRAAAWRPWRTPAADEAAADDAAATVLTNGEERGVNGRGGAGEGAKPSTRDRGSA